MKTANDRFAESVATAIETRTLRYSRRLQLLREADSLGIERFEANLIIAMVQHRLNASSSPARLSRRTVTPWLMIIAVQSLVILAGVWIWTSLR